MIQPMQISGEAPRLPRQPLFFAFYFVKFYWPIILAMVTMEIGQATCQILIPYSVKQIIDLGSQLQGTWTEAVAHLKPALTFFAALSVGILIFSRISGSLLVIVGPALRRRVRFTIYHYLQYHSQRFFISNFSGSVANRISEVAMGVNHTLWTVLFDFLPVAISFGVSFYLLGISSSKLATLFGIWVLFYIGISFFLAVRCQKYAKNWAATRSTVSGKIVDSVTNAMNTKLFARLDFERDYLSQYLELEMNTARKSLWFMEGMRWFQFIATMGLQISIILLSLKYWQEGQLTIGSFAMVTSLSLLVINDARGLSRRFLEFFEYIGNIQDGVDVIVRPHEIIDRVGAGPLQVSKGEIRFAEVNFKYGEKSHAVFQDLNITIKAGERVGLVGFSGSGKTTFVNLILRMFDVQSGTITIDGQDIKQHRQDSLRAQISMIPQEPMLFHRSLMENIRYGMSSATDEEVIAAARAAKAHEFIMQVPEGYAALVGERGVKLSGGQRQRIAIARAILKNAPILMMDEATSSLDSVTEKAIQGSLQELMKNRTVIVVAHRLSTIANLNRILVFDKGQIIEDGTHDELLKSNGHYALLWSMQVGGFLPENREEEVAPVH